MAPPLTDHTNGFLLDAMHAFSLIGLIQSRVHRGGGVIPILE